MDIQNHRDSRPVASQNEQVAAETDAQVISSTLQWVNRDDVVLAYLLDNEAINVDGVTDEKMEKRFQATMNKRFEDGFTNTVLSGINIDAVEWNESHAWEAGTLFEMRFAPKGNLDAVEASQMIFRMCQIAYKMGKERARMEAEDGAEGAPPAQ